ncbi:hypothetical protein D3C86_1425270 [compost metagenome]
MQTRFDYRALQLMLGNAGNGERCRLHQQCSQRLAQHLGKAGGGLLRTKNGKKIGSGELARRAPRRHGLVAVRTSPFQSCQRPH